MGIYKIRKEGDFKTTREKASFELGKNLARIWGIFSSRPNSIFFGRDLSENTNELVKVKEILEKGKISGKEPEGIRAYAGTS